MAITDKLQKLYVKLGGDEKESASNISEWLAKINDKLGGDREGYPSNIEDWIDKIEDVWSGGSVGDSIPVEWTTIVDEEAAEFIYNQTSSSCDATFYFNTDTTESWPAFNVFNLMVDGEALGASAPIGGSQWSVFNNNGRYYTVGVAYLPNTNICTVGVLNEESFAGTHAVKIDIGLVGSEHPSSSEG